MKKSVENSEDNTDKKAITDIKNHVIPNKSISNEKQYVFTAFMLHLISFALLCYGILNCIYYFFIAIGDPVMAKNSFNEVLIIVAICFVGFVVARIFAKRCISNYDDF